MKSVMSHQFSRVPNAEIQRSSFDRSHGLKTTFDAGYLIPVYLDEVLPGDTFNMSMNAFARLATPIKPIMDNMFLESFFFCVPMRLVWEDWQHFMGEKDNPDDDTDYVVPHMHGPAYGAGGIAIGSLSDYMGLPAGALNASNAGIQFNSLWHRAYNLIWNEWFRDQNLQDSVVVDKDAGPDTYTDYVLLRRGKRHDYFTSCLPWPQKGDEVTLPLGTRADVLGIGGVNKARNTTNLTAYESNGSSRVYASGGSIDPSNSDKAMYVEKFLLTGSDYYPNIYADLSTATAATINSLREAFQLQRLYERDARGGTRYTEIVKSHFGVTSPDARLQRPEYLGGGSTPVNVHPVAQTSGTSGSAYQGNLAAFGTVGVSGHSFTKSFTEHCLIIGLVSVRADLTYQQGLNRMFSRQTRFDFYWPALAHLGEQAVLNKEIFAQGLVGTTSTDDEGVFGYQERYAEYRYKPSQITGEFRSVADGSLDVWHLAQDFGSTLPTLGASFIQDDPPIDRVIAVPSEPHFIFDAYFNLRCARPMPVFGVPGLIDHF